MYDSSKTQAAWKALKANPNTEKYKQNLYIYFAKKPGELKDLEEKSESVKLNSNFHIWQMEFKHKNLLAYMYQKWDSVA